MKTTLILSFLFITTLASANELEKEIKYLGNNGLEESHLLICVNDKTGIVTINNQTQEMRIKKENTSKSQNLGRATFSQAAEIICK